MSDAPSLFSARIVTVPFVHADGQIDVRDYPIYEPESVVLEDGWVHVVRYDDLGNSSRVISYPAHEVQRVEWIRNYEP